MLKKVLAVALAAAMIFGLVSVAFAASPFPDTAGVEQEAAIAQLKALGLVKGDENGNFRPYSTITRAEFTAMVVRMLNLEAAASYLNTPTVYPDVTSQYAWAYGYINIATGKGLVKGFDDGTFRPGEPVTQAQALTILLRALGYNDNLPGEWPIDYVMQGAELGIIGSGFVGNVGATRAYVAEMVLNTLNQVVVKEDKDAPGTFVDKYTTTGVTLYKDAFGLRAAGQNTASVSGVVSAYSSTNGTITIGGTAYGYVSGVTIYGKDKLADLLGQTVSATLNKDGKIVFIQVTTALEVVGKITAVDTVNNKVTVGGSQYALASDVVIYKNNQPLLDSTTIAGALVAIKDANAKLLLNSDGKVYRIDASLLDLSGSVEAKQVKIGPDGSVKNEIQVKDEKDNKQWYTVTSSTVIVRNGASATYADIKVGDEIEFSANTTSKEVIYADLWYQVLEGYKVISYKVTSDGAVLVASKDGVETTFKVQSGVNLGVELGSVYKLQLNRAGEVKYAEKVTASGPEVGDVRTVQSLGQAYDASKGTVYEVFFTDGTSLTLNDLTFEMATKNANPLIDTKPATVWANLSVKDFVRLEKGSVVGNVQQYKIFIYSATLSGRLTRTDGSPQFTLTSVNGNSTSTVTVTTDWDTEVTVNGVRVLNTTVPGDNSPDDDFVATVTLTGTDKDGKPLASKVAVEKFVDAAKHPVAGIVSTGDDYVFTLDRGTSTVDVTVYKDAIVMKDGVKVTAADIKIGDLVQYSDNGLYVAATTDEDEPTVSNGVATWTAAQTDTNGKIISLSKLVVTFKADEPCAKGYVWVAGTQYAATFDRAAAQWTCTIEGLSSKPSVFTYAAQDYAGNVSSAATANVQ